jgi:type II secretory ATPase GspE/PulE/Tfp pilus assembly ATPase PilB-like protein
LIQTGPTIQNPSRKPLEESDHHIIRLWQEITLCAIDEDASDIHIEARQNSCVVRFRIHGDLCLFRSYPKTDHIRLITRIKILAKLDIAEQRLPQDGRLTLTGGDSMGHEIDCRVSTMPTLFGEKAVIRLLRTTNSELDIDRIGLTNFQMSIVKGCLSRRHGLILVCGPTGSGKTRTLYSFLHYLNQPHLNLCSVEDPIEIRLQGVNQIAYHPKAGLHFDAIIRALLRQDPDVMMIGEIRDAETAKLAVSAAQTGHLVLSTIHTRQALSCIERLKNFGVEPYSIAQNLLFVSSQRLIRYRDLQLGRFAIHEVLPFTPKLISAIELQVTATKLEEVAHADGFRSMRQEAEVLFHQGLIDQSVLIHEIP